MQAKRPLSAISGYATMGLNWEIFNSFSKYQSKDLSFQEILPMYMLLSKDLSHVMLAFGLGSAVLGAGEEGQAPCMEAIALCLNKFLPKDCSYYLLIDYSSFQENARK